jgi:hypothetical protein
VHAQVRPQKGVQTYESRPAAFCLFGAHMAAKTITIEMADDGSITVSTSEGGEPYECQSIDECRKYVDMMLSEEQGESPEEQSTEGQEDYGKMWNQEAKSRQPQPGLMA